MGYVGWLFYQRSQYPDNNEYGNFGEQIPAAYDILGIDISHYQEEINWNQVSQMTIEGDSIQFVFIKATEGATVEDSRKRQNAFGARSVEIDYGFYHFFRHKVSATEQAHFFCDEIGGYNFDLRPVLDVEPNGYFSKSKLKDSIAVFLDVVESRLNTRPLVYTYFNLYESTLSDLDETFWVAKYSKNCPAMADPNVVCWQFSEKGTVDGINEKVDLNVGKDEFFEKVRR